MSNEEISHVFRLRDLRNMDRDAVLARHAARREAEAEVRAEQEARRESDRLEAVRLEAIAGLERMLAEAKLETFVSKRAALAKRKQLRKKLARLRSQ